MMQRLSGKVVALSALVLFLSYIGYRLYETKSDAAALQAKTLEDAVPTVAVVHPKPADASETITLPGNITAWFEAPIYAQVSGYVKMWYKDYGAQVKKGDILAEINAPALDAQYAQAKADLDSERAKYALADITAKRWVALRPNQAVSEQSISVKVAEAKAEAATEEAPKKAPAKKAKAAKAETAEPAADGEEKKVHKGKRAEKIGVVTSDKMTLTVVVRVDRLVKHPIYRKYVRKRKKFMAHDEKGAKIGDKVRIVETRPMSARKRWRVVEIIQKAEL